MKIEATCSSEKSVDFQRTAWWYVAEDKTLHNYLCENLKSYLFDGFVIARICTKRLHSSQEFLKLNNKYYRSERPQINVIGNLALWILLRAHCYIIITRNFILPSFTWHLVSCGTTELWNIKVRQENRSLWLKFSLVSTRVRPVSLAHPCPLLHPLLSHTFMAYKAEGHIPFSLYRYSILPRVPAITVLYLFLMLTASPAHFYLLDFTTFQM
jgi:hypothetical protein